MAPAAAPRCPGATHRHLGLDVAPLPRPRTAPRNEHAAVRRLRRRQCQAQALHEGVEREWAQVSRAPPARSGRSRGSFLLTGSAALSSSTHVDPRPPGPAWTCACTIKRGRRPCDYAEGVQQAVPQHPPAESLVRALSPRHWQPPPAMAVYFSEGSSQSSLRVRLRRARPSTFCPRGPQMAQGTSRPSSCSGRAAPLHRLPLLALHIAQATGQCTPRTPQLPWPSPAGTLREALSD